MIPSVSFDRVLFRVDTISFFRRPIPIVQQEDYTIILPPCTLTKAFQDKIAGYSEHTKKGKLKSKICDN